MLPMVVKPGFEFEHLGLQHLTELGVALRARARRAVTLEDTAQLIVDGVYERFEVATEASLPLFRLYLTRSLDELPPNVAASCRAAFPDENLGGSVRCLSLAASRGIEPAWNDVTQSRGHRAIPLPSDQAIQRLPMVLQLVKQLGLDVSHVVQPSPELMTSLSQTAFNAFHVADARDSPHIPAQEGFVKPYGIRSAFGFGGALPTGHVFAAVGFSTVPVSATTARLFELFALYAKLCFLESEEATRTVEAHIRMAVRSATMEQLLVQHETKVVEWAYAWSRSNAQLRERNQELEEFAYIASHDLQEPLRTVAGHLQILKRRYVGKLDNDADEFIGFAVEGAQRMQALIESLISYSRITTQAKAFEVVQLEQVLDEALENLAFALEETKAVIERGALPSIRGDRVQLVQLFQNLIANSLKFAKDSGPHIAIFAQESARFSRIEFRDHGIGFNPRYADRIFKIFNRLQRNKPGTGIGLAICKKIVQRHDGELTADAEPGVGATFTAVFPRYEDSENHGKTD
jgi:signal transduction histidine kinase